MSRTLHSKPLTQPQTKRAGISSSPQRRVVASRHRWAVWLATGLGVGYLPVMPGTYGSVLGVALYWGLAATVKGSAYPQLVLSVTTVILCASSIGIIAMALQSFTTEDPQPIVLDEVAGQFLTLLPLSFGFQGEASSWMLIVAGFGLFRALDAIKPYPIWKLGRLKGSWGVVADDLGAGLIGAVLLAGLARYVGR